MTNSGGIGRSGCWLAGCCLLLAMAGCSRTHYRLQADREAYASLAAKSAGTPWAPPADFNIAPHPQSRFFDPTPADDPLLPVPAPQLYAYRLPELPERDPLRYRHPGGASGGSLGGGLDQTRPHALAAADARAIRENGAAPRAGAEPAASAPGVASQAFPGGVRQASFQVADAADGAAASPPGAEVPPQDPMAISSELGIVPIPPSIWQSLPANCLMRMFEFNSVREEYRRTFGSPPSDDQRDQAQRLALEDIVQLALLNSREFQVDKENLYEAALRLSLRRFEYELKFTPSGNGTDVDFVHNRVAGTTVNNLGIPTSLAVEKALASGGNILASFGNTVALTFNGSDGFAADVGSALAFDFSQSVFQRDTFLESLTQAERDLVYESRAFARSRKLLFQNLSGQYYSLLLNYREIEISVQDYFSNLRGWLQSEAEYRADRRPRFEVDQFEQRSLESRRRLIASCNSLEQELDRLKLQIGLPPETPVNVNLLELQELTLRDETAATEERVQRTRRNLLTDRQLPSADTRVLVNGALELVRRMQRMLQLRQQLSASDQPLEALQLMLDELSVEESRLDVQANRRVLEDDLAATPAAPPLRLFQRSMELADSLLLLIARQLPLVARLPDGAQQVEQIRLTADSLRQRHQQLQTALNDAVANRQLDRLTSLVQDAMSLLDDTQTLADDVAQSSGTRRTPEQIVAWVLQSVDQLLQQSGQLLAEYSGGLVPVEIEMDEAMLTAVTLRFDVTTQRELLADNWRDVKLRGDDLKSVLNLQASQQLRTRSDVNRPFDFTFDDSRTRLGLQFDAPLNRKAQRNAFRQSLIDYNRALRNLMAAEDDVKFAVRNDLRNLQVDIEQYRIAVASAALAYERVVTTNLQLQLGVENITARDVFEAQQDYTASLNALASAHIRYIQDRIQLFMNLELLEVDDEGFWPELYDERHQPTPNYDLPVYGRPVYGELVPGLLYSHPIQRMLHIPPGQSMIFQTDDSAAEEIAPPPAVGPIPFGTGFASLLFCVFGTRLASPFR